MNGRRIHFSNHISTKQMRTELELRVWRQGKELVITMPLNSTLHDLQIIPNTLYGQKPRYAIIGGVVLGQLTSNYLAAWSGRNRPPAALAAHKRDNFKSPDRDEVVIIQRVLPHAVNQGYHNWAHTEITSINDVPLKNLAHAIEIIDQQKSGFLRLQQENGYELILNIEEARAHNPQILQNFNIPRARSNDLE
jgi:hypothetical protein